MEIKVKFSINVGTGSAQTEVVDIEVDDDWREKQPHERSLILDEHWNMWSTNYLDGYAKELEDGEDEDE